MTDRPEDRWPDFVPPADSPLWGSNAETSPHSSNGSDNDLAADDASGLQPNQFSPLADQSVSGDVKNEPSYRQFAPPAGSPITHSARSAGHGSRQRPDRWFNSPTAGKSSFGSADPKQTSVTKILIGICVVVWMLQMLSPTINSAISLVPSRVLTEPWRLLTSAFAHSTTGITHIGVNMLMLYLLGRQLEEWLGKAKFLAVYLLSAFGGSAVFALLANPNSAAVGASGAIFGLFGAFFVIAAVQRQPLGSYLGLLLINVVLALFSPGIAWQSHLGGAAVGALAMGIYLWDAKRVADARRAGRPVKSLRWPLLIGIVVVLIILMVARLS